MPPSQRGGIPPRQNSNQLQFPPFPTANEPPQGHAPPGAYQLPPHHIARGAYGHNQYSPYQHSPQAPHHPQNHSQVHGQAHPQSHPQNHTQSHAQNHAQGHAPNHVQNHPQTHQQSHSQSHTPSRQNHSSSHAQNHAQNPSQNHTQQQQQQQQQHAQQQAQQQQQQQQQQQHQQQQQQQQHQQQQQQQQQQQPPQQTQHHGQQSQQQYVPGDFSYSTAPSNLSQVPQFVSPFNVQHRSDNALAQSPRGGLPSNMLQQQSRQRTHQSNQNSLNQSNNQSNAPTPPSINYQSSPRHGFPNNASNQHINPSSHQINAPGQHINTGNQQLGASAQHLQQSAQHLNNSNSHLNSAAQRVTAQSQHMSPSVQHTSTPNQHMHQSVSDDTLAERLRESIDNDARSEPLRPNTSNNSNETYALPAVSSAPTAQEVASSDLLQPEAPAPSQSRKRSAEVKAETPASNNENASPAPKRAKQEESKVVYTVVVADLEPHDSPSDEVKVQTVYCAGTYATKPAANGAAWSHLLQGFGKADFNCEHSMIDGCSRIEVRGLRPLQEEPKTPEMLAARVRSSLIATVTPITVPDVPLNITVAKLDIVYIVTLMHDDGHFDPHKKESNTEILGVYHNVAMAKWHAHATLTKFYGPQGRNAVGIDKKIAEKKDTVMRFAIREGPETKIIEVLKKKVGGPMSNTWSSTGPPPNIHGIAATRQAPRP